MAELESISVVRGNVEMRAFALGAGPPVLLVHGFGQSHRTWAANLEALASRYRVFAVDLPGFGASTKVALPRLEDYEDFLVRLLEGQGFASAHVVGHSFGGLMALGLALDHPARVRSLAVLGTSGMGPTVTDFRSKMARARMREEIKAVISRAFHDPARINDLIESIVEGQLAYRAQPGVMELLAEVNDRGAAWIAAVQARLDEIKLPMLVLWGSEDSATSPANADRVRGLPNVEVYLFAGAGHAAQFEDAAAFNAKLMQFLDAQPSGG